MWEPQLGTLDETIEIAMHQAQFWIDDGTYLRCKASAAIHPFPSGA
ncbi:MAG TPA: hypothetical protein VND66_15235 [Acidobacteriaceae bacterium]|nr:hypothetical protein [Terriglobia bacterium]HVC91968.1 hypothetical protein [Acidobacteriaceae bacterium]